MTEEMGASMDKISSLISELHGRSLRYSSPEIIMLEGVPIAARSLPSPGTVTCLVAKQGSPLLGQIRSAAYRKDYDELRRHGNTIARAFARISRQRGRLFESPNDIQVLTEFRYGDRILAQGMFTSETLPVATASILYNGGPLHDNEFHAVNYFHPGFIPDTEHVVVISMPSLTELEQAILSRVPEEHSQAFVSMPGILWPAAAAPEEEERTVEREALEEIDGRRAEDVGSQQEDFFKIDETASLDTLLKIRMQSRKRR